MKTYLDLLRHVMAEGVERDDRTGVGTIGVFGYQMRFDISEKFPLLTTKKVHLRSIIIELLWFLHGRTDNQWLNDHGVTIWDEWATETQCARFGRLEGDLGPIYGHQWRNGAQPKADSSYEDDGYDQIGYVLDGIRNNPTSRRLIVSGWHPVEQDQVALPPCTRSSSSTSTRPTNCSTASSASVRRRFPRCPLQHRGLPVDDDDRAGHRLQAGHLRPHFG